MTQLIDKAVDGLDKLNVKEGVSSGWFISDGDEQIIYGKCTSNEDRLWGNLSALTNDGKWLAVLEAMLESKRWHLNPNPRKLDCDC